MGKKTASGLRPDGAPVTPPDVRKPDGFIADAPLCAILSIDGETAVSGRVTTLGNVQVNLVSAHYNVALKMSADMAVRMLGGLTALVQKLGPRK
jgi:hypothetical protein